MTTSTTLTRIPLHKIFSGRDGMPSPRSIDNPMALHSTVMRLFGPIEGGSPRAAAGVLFRVEPASPGAPGVLLVRSAAAPVAAIDGMISRTEGNAPTAGTPVAFRLAANAVRRRGNRAAEDGRQASKGTMVGSVPRDDDSENDGPGMTEWVAERLAGAIGQVEILSHDRRVVGKKTNRVVQTDLVDGFGVVEDPAQLAALLASGVGRAKNYGCGLLTIKAIG